MIEMHNTRERAVSLTDYFIALPPLRYFIIGIFLIGIIFGIGINAFKYRGLELLTKGSLSGILLLSLPAFVSAMLIKIIGRVIPFKRIAAATFVAELLYALTYACGILLAPLSLFYTEVVLFLGAGLIFVLWYVIGRLVFILKIRSIFFAILQLLVYLLFLFSTEVVPFEKDPLSSVPKFYISSFIFLGALYLFFLIINAPMKRSFDISSTDAFSFFVAQWLYHNKDLEGALAHVGTEVRTLLSFMAFERGRDKIFFVTPYVHFGPFGNLGGSEFPYLIADGLEKKYGAKVFVFHPTVTHDLNPVSSSELEKIMNACDLCINEARYKRVRLSFSAGRSGECTADILRFNGSAFIGLTRAPHVTEDINFGLGLALMSEAEKNAELAVVVDQHNAETGEITSFEPGDPIGFRYMQAIKDGLEKKAKATRLEIGVSQRAIDLPFIGKAGIKIAFFSTSPEYVLILIDANGITPQFREHIVSEVSKIGKQYKKRWVVGVYTTDTHEINIIRGGLNPVKEESLLLNEIKAGVVEAMYDVQPARYFATKRWFDINVLGAGQSIEIVSTMNSIVAVAKIIGPVILLGSIGALLLILTKI